LLILRLTLAFVLVSHGGHILFGLGAGGGLGRGGLSHSAALYTAAGLNPGNLVAAIVGIVEFAGGLLIGIGALTRYACVAAIGIVGVLMWKIQLQWGFFLNWTNDVTRGHGMEFSIVLMGMLACLILTGPGDFSLDGRRASSAARRAAGRARLRSSR
jgi:putative oxidoreductase